MQQSQKEAPLDLIEQSFSCRGRAGGALADGRFALSGATPHYAPDRIFDTRHIRLELELDYAHNSLAGTCTTTLAALTDDATTMTFDAVNFQNVKVTASRGKV